MTVPAIVVSGEGLERNLERPRLERNWSGHRPHGAQNRPERASTTPVDLQKMPFMQVKAVVQTFLAVIPEGAGPVNPAKPGSWSLIFSLPVLRLFLGALG